MTTLAVYNSREDHAMDHPRSLPVNLDELSEAMEMRARDTIDWFLDTQTGKVILVSNDLDEDEPLREAIDNDDSRYEPIPENDAHDSYGMMEEFVATLQAGGLRNQLENAIHGKGAFGRFKRALDSHPSLQASWYAFQAQRQQELARDWLRSLNIESTWQRPDQSEAK